MTQIKFSPSEWLPGLDVNTSVQITRDIQSTVQTTNMASIYPGAPFLITVGGLQVGSSDAWVLENSG